MSYRSIRSSVELPAAVPYSENESARFGLDIGRLELGPEADVALDELVDLIETSPLDVIVFRYPASWTDLSARFVVGTRHCHQADTLMYYRCLLADRSPPPSRPGGFSSRLAGEPGDRAALEQVVRLSFDGYGSHYSTHPL